MEGNPGREAHLQRAEALAQRLAENIRRRRLAQKPPMTQQALAQAAGLSLSTVQKIEGGQARDPGIYVVATLAKALGVTIDQLVGPLPGRKRRR